MARIFESVGSDIYQMKMFKGGDELTLLTVANSFSETQNYLINASQHYISLGWKGETVSHVISVYKFLDGALITL